MRTLEHDMPTIELQHERVYTFAQLQAQPFTQTLASAFMALETDRQQVVALENRLLEQQFLAAAMVDVAVLGLGLAVDHFLHALLVVVNNERQAALYQRFFDKYRPSELKRMVISEQLTIVRPWPRTLAELPQEVLHQHGLALEAAVAKADQAITAEAETERAVDDFREVGERKNFVDRFNALRKVTFGKLAEMVHMHPEYNLPRDFPEQFFLRERRPRTPTIEGVQETIDRLERELARQQELLSTLEEAREKSEQARLTAERNLAAQELAVIEAETAKAMARAAELKSIINK